MSGPGGSTTSGGPVVVVTTMPLSNDARADLSEMLGDEYVVMDIKKAPTTANVVLTSVVTGRTLGSLRRLFPDARILLTEFDDPGRGIDCPGPISRALEAGPDGYFVAHGLESLPAIVHSEARLQLAGSTDPTQPMIDVGADRASAASGPPGPPVGLDHGGIVWLDHEGYDGSSSCPTPRGVVLELEHLDEAVTGLLRSSQPRTSPLWTTLVAETAVHLAREHRSEVVVDVTGLSPAARAELRAHVASERIPQTTWPPPGPESG